MTNDALPKKKKRYEPPSITSPESNSGGSNFHPAGITGCGYGAYGATCSPGTDPQGTPASCNAGGSPLTRNCDTGTNAGNDCTSGTDAFTDCNTGTRVQGDCANGETPLGDECTLGGSAGTCSGGTSGSGGE